ncbi:hypothetical protein C0993_011260, partial [Termitomyces sp. T159_Od127]
TQFPDFSPIFLSELSFKIRSLVLTGTPSRHKAYFRVRIDNFYPYSSRFGFFLNVDRFHASFMEPEQIGHYCRPTPALLNAMYLWGTHLAPSPLDGCDEEAFLQNSLHHLSKDLSSSHPHKIIQSMQTEVLLSYYYLMHGKVLAGHYHANAAVSLCLSSGFHRIRTPELTVSSSTSLSSPRKLSSSLAKAKDDAEEGERVDAFWAVLVLNNTWIALQESHSMFYDLQTIGVDTPWPMDAFEYELQLLPSVSSDTIKGFLDSTNIEGFSVMALRAKAAVLLEQATVYASNPDELESGEPSEFIRLDAVIDQFKSRFPIVDRMDVTRSEMDTLLMMQMMTHAATIKLHLSLFHKGEMRARQKALAAAQEMAILTHDIPSTSSIRFDPIVGVS